MANPPRTPESMSFGEEVRKRRKRAKITQDELADRLNVVRSYVSQVETGATQCREDFSDRLDEALGSGSELSAAWKEHIAPLLEEPAYPNYFADFEKAEQSAEEIRTYQAYYVPGLLQTEAYARAQLRDEDAVAVRMKRQAWLALNRFLCVVLEESVLYRRIGSTAVMREQLEHLVKVSFQENVKIQIAPFAEYAGVRGSFVIARLPNLRDAVYAPHAFAGDVTHEPAHTAAVNRTMTTLQCEALNVNDSREFMRKVIAERYGNN